MQDIIDKEFKDQIIIAVVHRFRFIHQFDRVLLMQEGKIVENDAPDLLLSRNSKFRSLYTALEHRNPTSSSQ